MYSRWMANLVQSFAQAGMLPRCAGWMVAEQSTHVPYPVCSTPAEEVRMDQDRSWKLGRWFGSGGVRRSVKLMVGSELIDTQECLLV